jgi:PAS domain S-box-containing protein
MQASTHDELTRVLADGLDAGVCVLDQQGRVTLVNRAGEQLLGRTERELLGTVLLELLQSPRPEAKREQRLAPWLLADGPVRAEAVLTRKDGTTFPAVCTAAPLLGRDGHRGGTVLTFWDVSEAQRAEQECHLLRTIARALSETEDLTAALEVVLRGVCEPTGWVLGQAWLVSPDGRHLICSPAWYSRAAGMELFRAASQDRHFARGEGLPGRAWATCQPAWSRDVSLDRFLARGRIARQVGLKAGMAIPVVTGSAVVGVLEFFEFDQRDEDGRLVALVGAVAAYVGQLIRRKQVEADRMALLAAEREHVRHLRELAVLKADFTALVAHELVSPLAALRSLVELLGTGRLSPDEQARSLATVRTELRLLTALVADVQLAASLEQDDFTVRPRSVPLADLLAEATAFVRALPGEHPVLTTGNVTGQVWADPERIGQVLRNLLANAAKYAPAGTPIELRATRRGEYVRLEIADQGPGIPPEDRARIFEKFWRRREHQRRGAPGLGLGLYVSRRLCRAHGTDLTVHSAPGQGTTFAFTLQLADDPGGGTPALDVGVIRPSAGR